MVQKLITTKYLSHFQVSLQYQGSHYCGATVLSAEYILTAAHCIYGYVCNTIYEKEWTQDKSGEHIGN
jgi:secreted trypsin-like serine protease